MMKKYLAVLVALLIGILLLMFGLMLVEQSADSYDAGADTSAGGAATSSSANFVNDLPGLPASDIASGNDIEDWCDAMLEKPNPDWTEAETLRFAKLCI